MKKYLLFDNLSRNSLQILSWLAIWSGLIYKFFGLKTAGVVTSVVLALGSFYIVHKLRRKHNPNLSSAQLAGQATDRKTWLLIMAYLILWCLIVFLLRRFATESSVISPWQTVPPIFFVLYFLLSLILFWLLVRPVKGYLFFVSLHFLLSFGVSLAVYRLGFGFDYFIHQATLELASQLGAVDPRPWYYLGQYGLLLVAHKISFLPLDWLHRLLVPLLAAVFLPAGLDRLFATAAKSYRPWWLLFLFALPLPFLAFTTPQNLALLFLLLVVIDGLAATDRADLLKTAVLSIAALLIHPVAGIPAMLATAGLFIHHSKLTWRRVIAGYVFLAAASALALPLAFAWLEHAQFGSWDGFKLDRFFNLPAFSLAGQENLFLNTVYLYGFNLALLLAGLILSGIIIAWRRQELRRYAPWLVVSGGLLAAYFITRIIPFNFLISYERDDYASRILLASLLTLAPLTLVTLTSLFQAVGRQNLFFRATWFAFGLGLVCISLYLTYPRYDRYYNSRGYSVGAADIEAARWIDSHASGDYIVLANQEVSAAALHEFGFKKYYQGDIFYYPIPTGGPLYQYYLEMVYQKPAAATIRAAMALAGVHEGYFVLNKYWWAFPKVLAEAKLEASIWHQVADGQVYVFKFNR